MKEFFTHQKSRHTVTQRHKELGLFLDSPIGDKIYFCVINGKHPKVSVYAVSETNINTVFKSYKFVKYVGMTELMPYFKV